MDCWQLGVLGDSITLLELTKPLSKADLSAPHGDMEGWREVKGNSLLLQKPKGREGGSGGGGTNSCRVRSLVGMWVK